MNFQTEKPKIICPSAQGTHADFCLTKYTIDGTKNYFVLYIFGRRTKIKTENINFPLRRNIFQ